MGRFLTVQFEGEEFPLYFSILAMEKIYDQFGNMQGMMSSIQEEKNPARQFSKILDVLTFENIAASEVMKLDGEKAPLIDKKKLLATLNPFSVEATAYWLKALEVINEGQERTVETESKNAEATQEETL